MTGTETGEWITTGAAVRLVGLSNPKTIRDWIGQGLLGSRPGRKRSWREVRRADVLRLAEAKGALSGMASADQLSAGEAAKILGVTEHGVRWLTQRGVLIPLGKRRSKVRAALIVVYDRAAIEAWKRRSGDLFNYHAAARYLHMAESAFRRLAKRGIVAAPEKIGRLRYFSREALDQLQRKLTGAEHPVGMLTFDEVVARLGRGHHYVKQLLRRGKVFGRRPYSFGRSPRYWLEREVDQLKAVLEGRSPLAAGYVSIPEIMQMLGRKSAESTQHWLRERGLRWIRPLGYRGAVRCYRRADVEAAAAACRKPIGLTARETATRLGLSRFMVRTLARQLRAKTWGGAYFYPESDVMLLKRRIEGAPDAYSGKVSVIDAARMLGVSAHYLRALLRRLGHRSAKPHGIKHGVVYYDVGVIEDLLFERGRPSKAALAALGYADERESLPLQPRDARLSSARERQKRLRRHA